MFCVASQTRTENPNVIFFLFLKGEKKYLLILLIVLQPLKCVLYPVAYVDNYKL